jgi:hypothetical protein
MARHPPAMARQQLRELHRLSATARVPSARMTTTNDEQRLINELMNVLRISEDWMATKLATVEAGSPFAGDDARTHPYELSHGVTQSITNAIDHLHCFRMALTGTGDDVLRLHTYAPFTLLRGAIENSAIAVWVMSPPGRRDRIVRHLRHEMTSANKIKRILKEAGDPVAPGTHDRETALLAIAGAYSIEDSKIKKEVTATEIVKSASETVGLTDGKLAMAFLFWKLCSGIAHGDRGLLHLFEIQDIEPIQPGISSVIVTAKTEQVLSGSRGAVAMITTALKLAERRSASHLRR